VVAWYFKFSVAPFVFVRYGAAVKGGV